MGDTETRFRLTLHYDGSAFHGWQIQPQDRTVQGELERVVHQLAGARRPVEGSGRTDTGVHATGQVAAVTMPSRWTASSLQRSLNALLPDEIWVEESVPVDPGFHPRFDARARTYRYHVGTAPVSQSPFNRRWCWPVLEPLDGDLLDRCAAELPGSHSFRSFAKSGQPERGYRCQIHEAGWTASELGHVFTVTADRYLHHMVRYLVGTMVEIGLGRRPLAHWVRLLQCEEGLETSPPAPPQGLFLARVGYETEASASEPAAPEPVPSS